MKLCEECGVNPAEVVVTTVVNGESTTRHLCRECLKKEFKLTDEQLDRLVENFKKAGCTLFR